MLLRAQNSVPVKRNQAALIASRSSSRRQIPSVDLHTESKDVPRRLFDAQTKPGKNKRMLVDPKAIQAAG